MPMPLQPPASCLDVSCGIRLIELEIREYTTHDKAPYPALKSWRHEVGW